MLDGTAAAVAQPSSCELDDGVDDDQSVRSAEQRVRRIVFGHFGFQRHAVGDVWRVGDNEVDSVFELSQQSGRSDVCADQFDRRPGDISPGTARMLDLLEEVGRAATP